MNTTKITFEILAMLAALLIAGAANAGFIDFEDGTDGLRIHTTFPGIEFAPAGSTHWIFGDWATTKYEGPTPDGPYYSNGEFFAWMGVEQGIGDIIFTDGPATWFTMGYSAQYMLTLEAYNALHIMVDTQTGMANLGSGELDYLTVRANAISYVRIKEETEFGNYWIIDDIATDAINICTADEQCDDGLFCNGVELCVDTECAPASGSACEDDGLFCNGNETCDEINDVCAHSGDPCADDGVFCNGAESCAERADSCVSSGDPCEDDGLFCNGDEFCDESLSRCAHTGDPCEGGENCDEEIDECVPIFDDDDEVDDDQDPVSNIPTGNDEDEEGWPEGKVTGGCCGC